MTETLETIPYNFDYHNVTAQLNAADDESMLSLVPHEIRLLHQAAMGLAEQAEHASRSSYPGAAAMLYDCAAKIEERCAQLTENEPSRSILFKSAAWLYLDAAANGFSLRRESQ